MTYTPLTQFTLTLIVLLLALFVHIGWINCRYKFWQYPEAIYFVAIRDRKTRNDFWHLVANCVLISAFITLIYYALHQSF